MARGLPQTFRVDLDALFEMGLRVMLDGFAGNDRGESPRKAWPAAQPVIFIGGDASTQCPVSSWRCRRRRVLEACYRSTAAGLAHASGRSSRSRIGSGTSRCAQLRRPGRLHRADDLVSNCPRRTVDGRLRGAATGSAVCRCDYASRSGRRDWRHRHRELRRRRLARRLRVGVPEGGAVGIRCGSGSRRPSLRDFRSSSADLGNRRSVESVERRESTVWEVPFGVARHICVRRSLGGAIQQCRDRSRHSVISRGLRKQ
jgi:hypothetical protein